MNEIRLFDVRDTHNPEGEEKRIVATLKSWGSRHALNVKMTDEMVTIRGTRCVLITWSSDKGEFKDRAWRVFLPLDTDMRTPGDLCAIKVLGSDGEWHWYPIPRRLVDRWLSQRLGNDFLPYVYNHHREFWEDLEGVMKGKYYTVPSWAQWALGSFQFHFLKKEVLELTEKGRKGRAFSSPSDWYLWLTQNA